MAGEIGAFEAKTHFSKLLERVEHGEEITITRRGKPVARLVPAGPRHDPADAMQAFAELRALAKEMKLDLTMEELILLKNEGRR